MHANNKETYRNKNQKFQNYWGSWGGVALREINREFFIIIIGVSSAKGIFRCIVGVSVGVRVKVAVQAVDVGFLVAAVVKVSFVNRGASSLSVTSVVALSVPVIDSQVEV